MKSLNSLVQALAQYNKRLADSYLEAIESKCIDKKALENDMINEIKNQRWIISQGKREDEEYSNYIDRYMIEKEID